MIRFVVVMTDFEGGSRITSHYEIREEADFAANEFWNGNNDASSVRVEDLR